jgi:hypothetical protein
MPLLGQAFCGWGGRSFEWDDRIGRLVPEPFDLLWCFTVFFRKIAIVGLGIAFAAISASPALAQQNSVQPHSGNRASSPAVKRTHWQPVRPVQATQELPTPKKATQSIPTPLPMADPDFVDAPELNGNSVPRRSANGRSVMQHPMPVEEIYHDALDGQIIYEGDHFTGDLHSEGFVGGGYGCDSIGGCGDGSCDGGCGNRCCAPGNGVAWRPCLTLCLPQDGWVSFEYLGWWQSGMSLPPLVTTSGGNPLPAAGNAGVLGNAQTRILFGGEDVLEDGFSGGRLQFGIWLDRCHNWAAAAEYFELSSRSESFSGNTNGFPVLARPFFNILDGAEDAQIVSYPGVSNGAISATATSELVGGGFHFRRQTNCNSGCGRGILCDGCSTFHSRTDGLFGYRYVQLDESVSVSESVNGIAPNNGSFIINDTFRTRNQFNGFDMGMNYQRFRGPWSLDLLAKMAIGNTRQHVDINGSTLINGTNQGNGGLLAQTSNIATYSRDRFTIMPELGANVGYQLTYNLKLKVGYTLIFWSNVVRPGDQIDLDINPNLFPPATGAAVPARPQFAFRDSDYWVQGISFGGEFTW